MLGNCNTHTSSGGTIPVRVYGNRSSRTGNNCTIRDIKNTRTHLYARVAGDFSTLNGQCAILGMINCLGTFTYNFTAVDGDICTIGIAPITADSKTHSIDTNTIFDYKVNRLIKRSILGFCWSKKSNANGAISFIFLRGTL
ncbi:MAG TPA: hypothetical protein H9749_06750 [Candidatus Acutalibacter stercorigallinarum]|nr:hypothetical protein [Candidatus Acutalibacter stercorigallinarum]